MKKGHPRVPLSRGNGNSSSAAVTAWSTALVLARLGLVAAAGMGLTVMAAFGRSLAFVPLRGRLRALAVVIVLHLALAGLLSVAAHIALLV
jgi:hypothetical protein